jgi:cation diffusion facilitator family transporter
MMQTRSTLTRAAQLSLFTNALLAIAKGVAGLLGNSYALIADAVESTADVFSSLIVWSGLRISAREADEAFHFGYGKAEALSAAVVSVFLVGAAVGIAIEAVREIVTPHHSPAPFTLAVLIAVVGVKELLFRRALRISGSSGSPALHADAWHHRSDALTSVAAFIGISIALIGGPGWESADDWAALVASAFIVLMALRSLQPAVSELMDRGPSEGVTKVIDAAVRSVPEVRGFHALRVRRTAGVYFIVIDVQADASMSLHDAHVVSGKVKGAIRAVLPAAKTIAVHMEPDEEGVAAGG